MDCFLWEMGHTFARWEEGNQYIRPGIYDAQKAFGQIQAQHLATGKRTHLLCNDNLPREEKLALLDTWYHAVFRGN